MNIFLVGTKTQGPEAVLWLSEELQWRSLLLIEFTLGGGARCGKHLLWPAEA